MDVATFVLAVVGTVLAVAGLVWQAATWVLEGGRAKVSLKVGSATKSGAMILSSPERVGKGTTIPLGDEQYDIPVVAIEVINSGRSPITVQQISLRHVASGTVVEKEWWPIGPKWPHQIEVGQRKTWAIHLVEATALRAASAVLDKSGSRDVVGVVELGDGRSYTTTERFTA
jgi:hypothetical protein